MSTEDIGIAEQQEELSVRLRREYGLQPLDLAIRKLTLEEISKLDLATMVTFAARNHHTLSFLYENGIIDDKSIEVALEPVVINEGRETYERHVKKGMNPRYIGSPICFAYAIQAGEFSERQKRRIYLQKGDSVERFCRSYNTETLLADLREDLLNSGRGEIEGLFGK